MNTLNIENHIALPIRPSEEGHVFALRCADCGKPCDSSSSVFIKPHPVLAGLWRCKDCDDLLPSCIYCDQKIEGPAEPWPDAKGYVDYLHPKCSAPAHKEDRENREYAATMFAKKAGTA